MTTIPQRLRNIAENTERYSDRHSRWVAANLRAIAAELEVSSISAVVIRPGRYLTRSGNMVYIACRCDVRPDGSKNEYPWLVEDGKRSWFVNDTGRSLKSGTTEFDIVSRVATSPPAPDVNELEAPAADAVPVVGYLFSRPGISKIDVAPHGGDWERLVRQRDHLATVAALQARINELESRQVPDGSAPITQQKLADMIQEGFMAGAKRGIETAVKDMLAKGWAPPQDSHPDTSKEQL